MGGGASRQGTMSRGFDGYIERQEAYVRAHAREVREKLGYGRYTDNQIKCKLRQEYHGGGKCNDYISQNDWQNIRRNY